VLTKFQYAHRRTDGRMDSLKIKCPRKRSDNGGRDVTIYNAKAFGVCNFDEPNDVSKTHLPHRTIAQNWSAAAAAVCIHNPV